MFLVASVIPALVLGLLFFIALMTYSIRCELRMLSIQQRRTKRLLLSICDLLLPVEQEANVIEFYTTINGVETRVRSMFLKATQKLPVSIKAKDKFGNDAKVDGLPGWAMTDESMGTLAVAEDGMSAEFTPSGKAGAFQIQAKADADLGEGVKEIIGVLDVEVVAGEAEVIEMAAGEPVDI